jgi:hypothetical protein
VQRFRSAAGAKKILAWFKMDDAAVPLPEAGFGFAVEAHRFVKAPPVGTSRFAYLTRYRSLRAKSVQTIDERFTDGRYLLQVEIASGTPGKGRAPASRLAKKLDEQLHLALAGRLQAKAPKSPPKLVAGRPHGGPDLSTLALQPADLATAEIDQRSYAVDRFALALSDYRLGAGPVGRYAELTQEIRWYRSANEAAFRAAYDTVLTTARWRPFSDNTLTLVDLDGIGQGERATILKLVLGNPDGRPDYLAIVGLSRGKATDVVVAESQSPLEPSDVQTLAQSMANRLDAGVTG